MHIWPGCVGGWQGVLMCFQVGRVYTSVVFTGIVMVRCCTQMCRLFGGKRSSEWISKVKSEILAKTKTNPKTKIETDSSSWHWPGHSQFAVIINWPTGWPAPMEQKRLSHLSPRRQQLDDCLSVCPSVSLSHTHTNVNPNVIPSIEQLVTKCVEISDENFQVFYWPQTKYVNELDSN